MVPDTTVPTPCQEESTGRESDPVRRLLGSLGAEEESRLLPHRHRVGVIDLELCRLVIVEGGPGGEQVEEHLQQVHVLPSHVGDLKDGTHPAEGGRGLGWII